MSLASVIIIVIESVQLSFATQCLPSRRETFVSFHCISICSIHAQDEQKAERHFRTVVSMSSLLLSSDPILFSTCLTTLHYGVSFFAIG